MRIGFDGGCLANRRGFGRFAREVLSALGRQSIPHEVIVFVDRPSADQIEVPNGFRSVVVDVQQAPSQAASARGRRGARDLLAMSRAAAREGLDLLYFPASYSFFPVWNVGRVIVTVFDALPLLHPELVFPHRRGRWAWRLKERVAVGTADRVLTTSNASRRDLSRWYRLPDDRIGVIPAGTDPIFRPLEPGPESEQVLQRYGLRPGERFLLYVGGLSPHKNLVRLIEGFARRAPADARLVLVGDKGDVFHTHVPELVETVRRFQVEKRVSMPGFVPDAELAHLYNRAEALIQPSLLEGFGLPPLEALACGTPVLSSLAGSLPEVVGAAGLYFEPTDTNAIASAIGRLFEQPEERERLAQQALGQAGRFSWDATAVRLLEEFETLDPLRHCNSVA